MCCKWSSINRTRRGKTMSLTLTYWVWKKGTCPLCLGKQDTKHILLECAETKNWRMEMLCKRWLDINEEVACRKMLTVQTK
jgi:hypothetical protein